MQVTHGTKLKPILASLMSGKTIGALVHRHEVHNQAQLLSVAGPDYIPARRFCSKCFVISQRISRLLSSHYIVHLPSYKQFKLLSVRAIC